MKCGTRKVNPFEDCSKCEFQPYSEGDCAISLALSEHLSSKEQLAEFSKQIRNSEEPSLSNAVIKKAVEALQTPHLIKDLTASDLVIANLDTSNGSILANSDTGSAVGAQNITENEEAVRQIGSNRGLSNAMVLTTSYLRNRLNKAVLADTFEI